MREVIRVSSEYHQKRSRRGEPAHAINESLSRPHRRSMALKSNLMALNRLIRNPSQFESNLMALNRLIGTPIHFESMALIRNPSQSFALHRTPRRVHARTGFGPGSRRLTRSGVISAWLAGFPSASEVSAFDAL